MIQPILASILKNAFLGAILIVSACLGQTAFGQEKDYVIPFTLTQYNSLSVQAVLNGKDTVNLMFHTAESGVTLTEKATGKLPSLRFDGTVDSVKSWGGAGNTSRFSKGNSVQIGELNWMNMTIWEDKNSGRGMDGKFGADLFSNKVVEIDFDNRVIVLHASLPEKARQYEKLKLTHNRTDLFMEASCAIGNDIVKNEFLIHSGYSGAVLFDDQFADETQMDKKLKTVDEKELKDSFGHVLKVEKAILPRFIIGKDTLSDVPVGFFNGAIGGQKKSIIGGDILKRFNIIIDAEREYIYLKPDSLAGTAYSKLG